MKNPGCTVITIAQQKGGAGKTTIASNLAVAFAQNRNKVAVIDIDPQGSLTQWYKIREKKFGQDYTSLYFSSTSGWKINSEISSLKHNFDFIIIDSPPHTETDAKTAIRAANILIIPVQPSPADLWATQATIELAQDEKVPYYILLNRVNANSKLAPDVAKEFKSILKTTIGNRVAFASALWEGKAVTETQPNSAAAVDIKNFVFELTNVLKKNLKAAA